MPNLVRKTLHLDGAVVADLERIIASKGGRRRGYSLGQEVTMAIREYVQRQLLHRDEAATAPLLERLLDERFGQLEAWLRPGVWGGATYGTTAALLLLEHMCGKSLDPKDARAYFDLIRGRAWKIIRKDPALIQSTPRSASPTEDD